MTFMETPEEQKMDHPQTSTYPSDNFSDPVSPSPKRSHVFIKVGMFLIGLCVILAVVVLFLLPKKEVDDTMKKTTTVPTTKPHPTAPVMPASGVYSTKTNNILYTVDSQFHEVAFIDNLSPNTSYGPMPPYFDEKQEQVYFSGQDKVIAYNLKTQATKDIYHNPLKDFGITSFRLQDENTLYVSLAPLTIGGDGYIEEYSIPTKTERKIGPLKNVIYGSVHYLFKTTKGDDVVASFGGDGCGSFGKIQLISSSEAKDVTSTGGGCSDDPRYLGNLPQEDQLVLLSVEKNAWDPTKYEAVDKLYTKDVYTGEEKTLVDLKPLAAKLKNYSMNETDKSTTLVMADSVWKVNALTGAIDKKETSTPEKDESTLPNIHNNTSYFVEEEPYTDNFNMTLHITDVATRKELQKINWGKKYPLTGAATIIGFWHDKPLINLYIYPKAK